MGEVVEPSDGYKIWELRQLKWWVIADSRRFHRFHPLVGGNLFEGRLTIPKKAQRIDGSWMIYSIFIIKVQDLCPTVVFGELFFYHLVSQSPHSSSRFFGQGPPLNHFLFSLSGKTTLSHICSVEKFRRFQISELVGKYRNSRRGFSILVNV